MRKIAATYLFPGNKSPLKNGILICEDDGTIVDVIEKGDAFTEEAGLEFYSGILVPGFVNAHCHLELSYLKGTIKEQTGIGGFIGKINQLRKDDSETIEKALQLADRKIWAAGTALAGDISNSAISIKTKIESKIHYHTFVECFGFHPSRAKKSFVYAENIISEFYKNDLSASIVPHSPYSVSEPLFKSIKARAEKERSILSIHNQESAAESEFFKTGTGPIAQHLQDNLGIDISHWKPGGESSLVAILKNLPKKNQLLLVHNTFTSEEDLEVLEKRRSLENTYFVLCPNSNKYIENCLPTVPLFQKWKVNICLGTDSLASNHQLSVLQEMLTLQKAFPEISTEDLIAWATINGAKALELQETYGSFEVGKKPGVNLISGFDFKEMKFSDKARVKRLL